MAVVPPEQIVRSARTRVKLYVLNDDRQWDDRGTGYVQAARIERKTKRKSTKAEGSAKTQPLTPTKLENGGEAEPERKDSEGDSTHAAASAHDSPSATGNSKDESERNGAASRRKTPPKAKSKAKMSSYYLVLYVVSEDSGSPLLRSRVRLSTGYQKQQETLIVWTEGDLDLALSFQERCGCDEVWEQICTLQGKDPAVDYTGALNDSSLNESSKADTSAGPNGIEAQSETASGSTSANASGNPTGPESDSDKKAASTEAEEERKSATAGSGETECEDEASGQKRPNSASTDAEQREATHAGAETEMDDDDSEEEEGDGDGDEEEEYEQTFVAGGGRAPAFGVDSAIQSFSLSNSSNMSFGGSMGGAGPPFELPECDLAHLNEMVEAFQTGSANTLKKERFTDALMSSNCDYLHRVRDLFRKCEDIEASELLPHFYELAKCIFVLNRHLVFEQLFADEAFFLDVIGMLEYDPTLNAPFAQAGCQFSDSQNTSPFAFGTTPRFFSRFDSGPSNAKPGARPPTPAAQNTPATPNGERPHSAQVVTLPNGLSKYNHREFLAKVVRFKQVFPFQREDVLTKIHETFRIQYVLENILPTPTIFEENQFSGLTSFLFMNKLEIVNLVGDDERCLASLFDEIITCAQPFIASHARPDESASAPPAAPITGSRSRSTTESASEATETSPASVSASASTPDGADANAKKDANANDAAATRVAEARAADSQPESTGDPEADEARRRERLSDLVQFLRELCSFTQSLTQPAKDGYFRRMASLGVMRAIECVMRAPLGGTVRAAIIEIFSYVVEFAPAVVREYVMHDAQTASGSSGKPLFLNLVVELLLGDDDAELGNAVQLSTVLRSLLDPDSMTTSAAQAAAATSPYSAASGSCASVLNSVKNEKTEFLKLFYAKCVPVLIAPLFEAVDGSVVGLMRDRKRTANSGTGTGTGTGTGSPSPSPPISVKSETVAVAPKRDDYRTALLLANIVDLLAFFIERHNYHMKNLVNNRDLVRKVLVLLGSRHLFLVLTALRLFRRVVGLKDSFYTQHIVQSSCFRPVVDLFVRHAARHNLVNSALLELFEFIRSEDLRNLVCHLVDSFSERLRSASPDCALVLRELQAKYDQYASASCGSNSASSCNATPATSANRHSASFSLGTRRGTPLGGTKSASGSNSETDWLNGQLLLGASRRSTGITKRSLMISEEGDADADADEQAEYRVNEYELSESLTTDQIRHQLSEQTKQLREAEREDAWFADDDDDELEVCANIAARLDTNDSGLPKFNSNTAASASLPTPALASPATKEDEFTTLDDDDVLMRVNRSSNSATHKRRRLGPDNDVEDVDDDEDSDELDRVWHQRFIARQNAYSQNAALRTKLSRSSRITIRNGPFSMHTSPNGAPNSPQSNRSSNTSSGTVLRDKTSTNRDESLTSNREQPSPPRSPAAVDEVMLGDVVVKSPVSSLVDYPDDEDEAQQPGGNSSMATSSPLSSPPSSSSANVSSIASPTGSSLHSSVNESACSESSVKSSSSNAADTDMAVTEATPSGATSAVEPAREVESESDAEQHQQQQQQQQPSPSRAAELTERS